MNHPILKIEVADADACVLLDEIQELHAAAGAPDNGEQLLRLAPDAAAVVAGHVPAVHEGLALMNLPNGPVAVEVEGLLPPGPWMSLGAYRLLALGLGSPLGEPFQFLQQDGGEVVSRLAPKPDAPAHSGTSAAAFGEHTDDAYLPPPTRTRHIALLPLVNASGATTSLALIDDVWERLSEGTQTQLIEQNYWIGTSSSHGGARTWTDPKPLVYMNRHGERCVQCPTYNVRAVQADAQKAFDEFCRVVKEVSAPRVLGPREISYMAFRNDRLLHARGRIDGPRELLRTYWRRQLRALRAAAGPGPVFDLRELLRV